MPATPHDAQTIPGKRHYFRSARAALALQMKVLGLQGRVTCKASERISCGAQVEAAVQGPPRPSLALLSCLLTGIWTGECTWPPGSCVSGDALIANLCREEMKLRSASFAPPAPTFHFKTVQICRKADLIAQ